MTKATLVGASAAVLSFIVGCGGSDPQPLGTQSSASTIQGTVPLSARTLDNPRAIAVSATGRSYWAYLDTHGDFSINAPSGHAYRVVVANMTRSGALRTVGHLTIHTTAGAGTWLGVRQAGKLNLGTLSVSKQGSSGGGIAPLDDSEGLGDKDADKAKDHEHDDDLESHDDDGDDEKVCSTSHDDEDDNDDDVELHASNEPGDKCKSDDLDDDKEKDDEDKVMSKPCPPGGAGGAGGAGGGGAASTTGGGATGGGATGGGATTTIAGGGQAGASCALNADCAAGLSCFASACFLVPK